MILTLTNKCSMGCTHCMSSCTENGESCSEQAWKDNIDFAVKNRLYANVVLISGGEPLEHPDALRFIGMAIDSFPRNTPIILTTNGVPLLKDRSLMSGMQELKKKAGRRFLIQITSDDRYYPFVPNSKELYWLNKIATSSVEKVPLGLYPQGRALENFPDSNWENGLLQGPKCIKCIMLAAQGKASPMQMSSILAKAGSVCYPRIGIDSKVYFGESLLCPPVYSIHDNFDDILRKTRAFSCRKCKIAWEKLESLPPDSIRTRTIM